jgi:hypothetical protein
MQAGGDMAAGIENLRADLNDAHAQVKGLRRALWPFGGLLKGLAWVPVIGDDVAAIPHTLEMADALLNAAQVLNEAFAPLLDLMAEGTASQDRLAVIGEVLADAEKPLAEARREVESAQRARDQIGDLTGLVGPLRDAITQVDPLLPLLDQGLSGLEVVPTMLGMDEPHHILILLQNADEMRATGGFITSTIYVVMDEGQITELTALSSDSEEIDHYEDLWRYYVQYLPPDPMYWHMQLSVWLFRDANWSPDFPTSAAKAIDYYTFGREVPVDTVVAMSQYTIRDFMAPVGPIALEDDTVIDADNFLGFLQESWLTYRDEQGYEARKQFIPDLAPKFLESFLRVESAGGALNRWGAVQAVAARGDLLIYSTDASIQVVVERLGWDGAVPTRQGDYLYVVDSNLSYNKTNVNVDRRMDYHISLTTLDDPFAVLDLEYRHRGTPEPTEEGICAPRATIDYSTLTNECHADYLRLYLPDETDMLHSPWFEIPLSYGYRWVSEPETAGRVMPLFDEREKEVYGGLMLLPPGETTSASFIYRLPPETVLSPYPDGAVAYTLLVQKQPGPWAYPLTVTIDLPPDAEVLSVTPEPTFQNDSTLYFETELTTNLEIEAVLHLAEETRESLDDILQTLPPAPDTTPTPRSVPTSPALAPEVRLTANALLTATPQP